MCLSFMQLRFCWCCIPFALFSAVNETKTLVCIVQSRAWCPKGDTEVQVTLWSFACCWPS